MQGNNRDKGIDSVWYGAGFSHGYSIGFLWGVFGAVATVGGAWLLTSI